MQQQPDMMWYDEAGSLMMADFKTIEERVMSWYTDPLCKPGAIVLLDKVGTPLADFLSESPTGRIRNRQKEYYETLWPVPNTRMK